MTKLRLFRSRSHLLRVQKFLLQPSSLLATIFSFLNTFKGTCLPGFLSTSAAYSLKKIRVGPKIPALTRLTISSTTTSSTMDPQFSTEDSDLIVSLHELSIKSPKLVKSTSYAAPGDPSIEIRSWKMNEFKYYDIPSPFPTLARGLFSRKITDVEKREKSANPYRIVVRGYDKFFNIGEVPWTTVSVRFCFQKTHLTHMLPSGPGWRNIQLRLTHFPSNPTDA